VPRPSKTIALTEKIRRREGKIAWEGRSGSDLVEREKDASVAEIREPWRPLRALRTTVDPRSIGPEKNGCDRQ